MDTRSGQLYESKAAAVERGANPRDVARVDSAVDEKHCQSCRRPLKVRLSTPSKLGSDGRLYRWCKRCWFTGRFAAGAP